MVGKSILANVTRNQEVFAFCHKINLIISIFAKTFLKDKITISNNSLDIN